MKAWQRRLAAAGGAALIGVLLLTGGCGSSGSTVHPPALSAAQPGWEILSGAPVYTSKAWTVLVYMNAANNLDSDSLLNVGQMESVGSSPAVNIVVQWKRDTGFNGATRRYYIQKNTGTNVVVGASSLELAVNPTADMGQAQTLQDFVQWGVHAFPAQRYCLVLWDHGAGWRAQPLAATTGLSSTASTASSSTRLTASRTAKATTRGISYDDLTGSHIDTSQLNSAIDVGNGFKWDLLAMDASLMQMVEVDYQMQKQAKYIIGSEESPSELGYPYNLFLADLTTHEAWDGAAFGVDIAQQTATYYSGVGADETYTQSVVDTSKLGALAPAISSFGAALTAAQPTFGTQISAARSAAETVFSPDYSGDYRDLTDFIHQLIDPGTGLTPVTDLGVVATGGALRTALSSAILFNVHGTEHPNMHGLTIFLVAPTEYTSVETAQAGGLGPGFGDQLYTNLAFTQAAPGWLTFLTTGPP